MAVVWQEDPPGQSGPQATCRGCQKGLWARGSNWADADGIEVCIKAVARLSSEPGERPVYVFHEPMPAGLRGAPAV
jgi:hypothetical protein